MKQNLQTQKREQLTDRIKTKSCPISCDQSDFYPGGKCDQNGCYTNPNLKAEIPQLQAIANNPETTPNFRFVANTLIQIIQQFEKLKTIES